MTGALLVDKPEGPTSHEVVRQVRRTFGADAAGHTGTLDPFATGLLIVLLGRATRLARFVESDRKTYVATARLGFATSTDDRTGDALGPEVGVESLSPAAVETALATLRGPLLQRPPAFSAKKVTGRRSYVMARRGDAPELPPVSVTVHAIELLSLAGTTIEFRCTVSAGTYVRALARDLGEALGCGAHLTALRREAIGALQVRDAVPLAALTAETPLLPPQAVLPQLSEVRVDAAARRELGYGRVVASPGGVMGVVTLVGDDGALVAIGEAGPEVIRPVVVLEPAP